MDLRLVSGRPRTRPTATSTRATGDRDSSFDARRHRAAALLGPVCRRPTDRLEPTKRIWRSSTDCSTQAVRRAVGGGERALRDIPERRPRLDRHRADGDRRSLTRQAIAAPLALSLVIHRGRCQQRADDSAGVARQLRARAGLVPFDDAAGPTGCSRRRFDLGRMAAADVEHLGARLHAELARVDANGGAQLILTGSGGDEWLTVVAVSARRSRRTAAADVGVAAAGDDPPVERPHGGRRADNAGMLSRVAPAAARERCARWMARGRGTRDRRRRVLAERPEWVAPDPAIRAAMDERVEQWIAPARPKAGFYMRETRPRARSTRASRTTWKRRRSSAAGTASACCIRSGTWIWSTRSTACRRSCLMRRPVEVAAAAPPRGAAAGARPRTADEGECWRGLHGHDGPRGSSRLGAARGAFDAGRGRRCERGRCRVSGSLPC